MVAAVGQVASEISSVGLFLVRVVFGLAAALAADPSIDPKPGSIDPAQGQIDGQAAMAVVPREEYSGDASKLVAKLGPMGETGTELTFPASSWFIPPPERKYRVWLEGEWEVSPFTQLIVWHGGPFVSRGAVVQPPLGPAGRVVLPTEAQARGHLALRLLHLGEYLDQGFLRWEFIRQEPVEQLEAGILMPEGPTLAALWDLDRGRYVALSRPFAVKAGSTVAAPLEAPPAGRAVVVLLLENHGLSRAEDHLEVLLEQGGTGATAPAVLARTAQTVYAVWYDLDPDKATLRIRRGPGTDLEPFLLSLQADTVHRVSIDLRKGEPIWRTGPQVSGLQK